MKANIRRELRMPEMGNKSREFIGCDFLFAVEWFPRTSSCKLFATSDPRIHGTNRAETAKLKSDLHAYGRSLGMSDQELCSEWRFIIRESSMVMTAALPFESPPAVIKRTKRNESLVDAAMVEAMAYLAGAVARRKNREDQWRCAMSSGDLFESSMGYIYGIRTFHEASRGSEVALKIGETMTPDGRLSAYRTPLGGSAEWEFLHKAERDITQKTVFLALKKYRQGKSEVFILPECALDILRSLPLLRELVAGRVRIS